MVKAKALTKRFEHVTAVDAIDFDIPAGTIFGMIGPNGAGKTTTVRMLTGILKPTEGDAWIGGRSVKSEMRAIRELLGVVPEGVNLYRRLTARETIEFFGGVHGVRGAVLQRRITELAGLLDLNAHLDRATEGLSMGTKKKVQFAAALAHQPEVLVCDEPTLALDPRARMSIIDILLSLKKEGRTVLLTSHNMELVESVCDGIAVIHQGRIRAYGRPDQLKRSVGQRPDGKEATLDDVFLTYAA